MKLLALSVALLVACATVLLYEIHSAKVESAVTRAPIESDENSPRTWKSGAFQRSEGAPESARGGGGNGAIGGGIGAVWVKNSAVGSQNGGAGSKSGEIGSGNGKIAGENRSLPANPLRDPHFLDDPAIRASVGQAQALNSAEHGDSPVERANGVNWLMGAGDASSYNTLRQIEANDPDPGVRAAAGLAAHVVRSRNPESLMPAR